MTDPINLTHMRERIRKTIAGTTTSAGPIRISISVAQALALIDAAEAARDNTIVHHGEELHGPCHDTCQGCQLERALAKFTTNTNTNT